LPVINPVPSNADITQSVAQQDQQNQQLAALVAANQALTFQVMQSAESTMYQTVDPSTIGAPDSTPAPQDMVDKIKSAQLIQH
jgi:hypothetical protein